MRSNKKGFCLNLIMINAKKNSLLLLLLFFFIAPAWSQLFDDTLLKISASDLYYQGIYPNVDQAFALYEDYNLNATAQEEINYFKMVTALRLNDPGAVKLIETYSLDYPNTGILKTVYLDLANYYFNNEKYSYAHKWFAKVKVAEVSKPALPKFNIHKPKHYWKRSSLTQNMSPMLIITWGISPIN